MPGSLLLFPPPASDLPDGRDYLDEEGGSRRFSASFYADLLAHLGVTVVLCLDTSPLYDANAFALRGVRHYTLRDLGGGGAAGRYSLQAVARESTTATPRSARRSA